MSVNENMSEITDRDLIVSAERLSLLAVPARARILIMLAGGLCSLKTIHSLADMPRGSVNHHLLLLRTAGAISSHRKRETYYRIEPLGQKLLECLQILKGE